MLRPEVRALSLSFSIYQADMSNNAAIVKEAYLRESDPLVRRSAIRIAGFVGHSPENLDLSELLMHETDPVVLKEVVEARSFWAYPSRSDVQGPELWEGTHCPWLEPGPDARPWEKRELQRLLEILEADTTPSLRDAASLAV